MKESYRIWDRVDERWLTHKDRVFINPDGEVVKVNKFGHIKKLNQQRYLVHYDVSLTDVNNKLLYEGDFVKLYEPLSTDDNKKSETKEEKELIYTVGFIPQIYSYVLFNISNPTQVIFLQDGFKVEIIGNVFDTPEVLELNPDLAEQVSKMKTFTVSEVVDNE